MLHKGATPCDLKATPKKVAFLIDNQLFIIVLLLFFVSKINSKTTRIWMI